MAKDQENAVRTSTFRMSVTEMKQLTQQFEKPGINYLYPHPFEGSETRPRSAVCYKCKGPLSRGRIVLFHTGRLRVDNHAHLVSILTT